MLTGYLMLSGAAIPTERAFVMNGLVFAAVLIDRLRISMRICALAAAFVLAIEPESFVGVSFQMSFGAVVALIAVYETLGEQLGPAAARARRCAGRGWAMRRRRGDDRGRDASAPTRSRSITSTTSHSIRRWPMSSRCH